MAEEQPKVTPPATTTEPDKTGKNDDGKKVEVDPAQALAQRDHWREKAEKAQAELDKKAADEKAAEEAKLVEQQKWQEIATKKDAELAELTAKLSAKDQAIQTQTVKTALTNELIKLNPVDLDAAIKLADLSEVKVAEDGTITGLDTVVKSLSETKPFLFGNKPDVNNGPKTPPQEGGKPPSGRMWTKAEIAEVAKNPKQYAAVREDILAAGREGRIKD